MNQFQDVFGSSWKFADAELHVVRRAAHRIQSSGQCVGVAVRVRSAVIGRDSEHVLEDLTNDAALRSAFEGHEAAVREENSYEWLLMCARALWTSFLFADGTSFVEDVVCIRQRLQIFHEAVEDLEDFA